MKRDELFANPHAARLVLGLGAAAYFLLCIPLHALDVRLCELNPSWLAMQHLWFLPVVLSAALDRWTRRRAIELVAYGLFAAFVVSWSPMTVFPGVFLVELISRSVYARLRRFISPGECAQCGYCLWGLLEPRCPECGTPFPREWLDPRYCHSATPLWSRWTTWLIVVALVSTAAFPPVYRAYSLRSIAESGRRAGEADWAAGTPTWHVSREELIQMSYEQQETFYNFEIQKDPASGMRYSRLGMPPRIRTWQSAYHGVIEQKLREAGRTPPDFRPPNVPTTGQSTTSPSEES